MLAQRNVVQVRVTSPCAFGRAGIRFAAGSTEMDLLDLSAQQIIALASEPMFVFEARCGPDEDWKVFPAPAPADLPILEAELALAKASADKARADLAAAVDAIAGSPIISGLSEATKLAMDGAYGLAILPGDGIGQLAASVADQNLAARLAAEAGRPDDDTDQTAAADAAANTDTTQSEGAVTSASADVAPAETEAGATSAPASGTKPKGKATK